MGHLRQAANIGYEDSMNMTILMGVGARRLSRTVKSHFASGFLWLLCLSQHWVGLHHAKMPVSIVSIDGVMYPRYRNLSPMPWGSRNVQKLRYNLGQRNPLRSGHLAA